MKAIFPDGVTKKRYTKEIARRYYTNLPDFFTKEQVCAPVEDVVNTMHFLLQEDNTELMALSNIKVLKKFMQNEIKLPENYIDGRSIAYMYWSGDKEYIRYQMVEISEIAFPEKKHQERYIAFIKEMAADVITTLCDLNEAKISDASKQEYNTIVGSDYFKIGTVPSTEISERPAIRTQTKSNTEKQPTCCLML